MKGFYFSQVLAIFRKVHTKTQVPIFLVSNVYFLMTPLKCCVYELQLDYTTVQMHEMAHTWEAEFRCMQIRAK